MRAVFRNLSSMVEFFEKMINGENTLTITQKVPS